MRCSLLLHDNRLTFVAIPGRGKVQHWTGDADEGAGVLLRAELDARRLRCRRVRLGLPRALATVKVIELPSVVSGDRREMLGFELDRHLPFPVEDTTFDAVELPAARGEPARFLVAAVERRIVERAVKFLDEARLKPASAKVACHELPALLRRRNRGRQVVWVHRAGGTTSLVFLDAGRLRWSRNIPLGEGEALADEIGPSLNVLGWTECDALWVSGDEASELLASTALASLGAPVSEPPWHPATVSLMAALPPQEIGTSTLALAVALGRRRPELDLLPIALRPHTWSPAQMVTAAMLVLTAGLGLGALGLQGYQERRHLERLEQAARALEPQVKEVEGIAAELGQKKRLLDSMRSVEASGIRALPLLRELTELLPADAWLSTVNVDLRSVELSGQANTASQLVPLLEGSPWLARVELTSPVTKGRDKEQFRLRAAWENGPGGPPAKVAATGERPGPPERVPPVPAAPSAAPPAPAPSGPTGSPPAPPPAAVAPPAGSAPAESTPGRAFPPRPGTRPFAPQPQTPHPPAQVEG